MTKKRTWIMTVNGVSQTFVEDLPKKRVYIKDSSFYWSYEEFLDGLEKGKKNGAVVTVSE